MGSACRWQMALAAHSGEVQPVAWAESFIEQAVRRDASLDETFRDDRDKEIDRAGYEINFNRYFYKYQPPRKLDEIGAELKQVEAEIAALAGEVTE